MNTWILLKDLMKVNCLIKVNFVVVVLIKQNIKEQLMCGNYLNQRHYHGLYLETDVLFLCDVFEKFIKTCLEYYSLNPSHYFSSPGLSWDAMLKMTGIKIELINNIEIIEKLRISYFNNSHFI